MRLSRYTGQPPASAACPECGRRVTELADGQGGDIFAAHKVAKGSKVECVMSRRAVPQRREGK